MAVELHCGRHMSYVEYRNTQLVRVHPGRYHPCFAFLLLPAGGGGIDRWRDAPLQLLQQRQRRLRRAPPAARRLRRRIPPAGVARPPGRREGSVPRPLGKAVGSVAARIFISPFPFSFLF